MARRSSLTLKDRQFIENALKLGNSLKSISKLLGINIYGEVAKNSGKSSYKAQEAHDREEFILKSRLEKARKNVKRAGRTCRIEVYESEFVKQFCLRLIELREMRKMNQLEAAEKMNLHPVTLTRIEQGYVNISLLTLEKIAEGLEIHPIELFKLKEEE